MFRCIFPMFLLAIILWGLTAALPCGAWAEGPSLALSENTVGPAIAAPSREDSDNPDNSGTEGPMLGGTEEDAPSISPQAEPPAESSAESSAESPLDTEGMTDIPEEIPPDQAALYHELQELRRTVDRLLEESLARDRLRITEEEERDAEEEILEAAGREYTLMPRGMLGMELNVNYSYYSYDSIRQMSIQEGIRLAYRSNHNIHNNLIIESARRDNLTIDAIIPFVYKYDQVKTERSRDITNLGDISLGLRYQPFKLGARSLAPILNTRLTLPTGRGDFDIDPARELSTGSGLYSLSGGFSVSHPFDPVNAFGTISYQYRFDRSDVDQRRSGDILEKVEPGDRLSLSMGFGYAVSYRMSMSLSYSYTYGFNTTYYFRGRGRVSTGDMISSSVNLNTAWRVSPRRTVITGIGIGLTNDDPDFNFSLRLPFQFDLR